MAESAHNSDAFYCCHGLSLVSDIPLPLHTTAKPALPDWSIRLESTAAFGQSAIRWDAADPSEPAPAWMRTGRSARDLYLVFPDLARFLVSPENRCIHATPESGVPETTLGHLLLNQVIPLALANEGHLMLHASVVAAPDVTVAFLGETGAGKTTMATALALRGWPLVTEDVVRLEFAPDGVLCHPCPSPPRLWPDSLANLFPHRQPDAEAVAHYTAKLRITIDPAGAITFTNDPVKLDVIALLAAQDGGDKATPGMTPVHRHQAFEKTILSLFRLKPMSDAQIRREFDWATELARRVPFYHLRYSREFSSLPAVAELLSGPLGRSGQTPRYLPAKRTGRANQ